MGTRVKCTFEAPLGSTKQSPCGATLTYRPIEPWFLGRLGAGKQDQGITGTLLLHSRGEGGGGDALVWDG